MPSKDSASLSSDELDVYSLLERAVMVAMYHTRPIELLDVPRKKNGYIDTPVNSDVCAYGIYPDLDEIEAAGKGPERHVFSWNLDKKLVMTCFRKLEQGQPVCIVEKKGEVKKQQATDMITFRCANELCPNFFPLKVYITKIF